MRFARPDVPIPASWRTALAAAACVAFAAWVLAKAWTADDAYITFRTCDNWLHGYGPRFNPAERVQAFTHPLWMFVMTAAAAVTHEYYYTSLFVGWGLSVLAVGCVARWVAPPLPAAAAVVILTASRAFSDFSTSGLENPLTHLLLAGFLVAYFRPGRRRVLHLSALAALVMVGRLDAGWLVLPAVASAAWQNRSRVPWRELALGFAPLWLWEVFSVVYYGELLPNSALAKLTTGIGGGELARQGARYFTNSLHHDPVTLTAIAAAIAVAAWRRDTPSVVLAVGIVLQLVWVLCVGGDFMSGRFLTAPLFVAVAVLARVPMRPVVAGAVAAAALCAGGWSLVRTGFTDARYRTDPYAMVPADGIVDERMFYDHKVALRHAHGRAVWPNPDAISEARTLLDAWWLDPWSSTVKRWGIVEATERWPPHGKSDLKGVPYRPVVVRGAIGYLAFDLGPEVHVLDFHGLADPLLARLPIAPVDPAGRELLPHMADRRWRIGHFVRLVPPGYVETLISGENRIRDPALARVYDDIASVTRGPLFDRRRFAAIWALHTGGYAGAIRAYQSGGRGLEPPPPPAGKP